MYKITGVRGSGKTVILAKIEEELRSESNKEKGWLVLDLNPARDMLVQIAAMLHKEGFGGNDFFDIGVEVETMLQQAQKKGKRILVGIDEVSKTPEMIKFASEYGRWLRANYPVLWLLPPVGCDHTAWQRNTRIEQIAEEKGIMVIMPDMKLSYGLNMAHGFSYFDMLTKELPGMAADYFPANIDYQMIAGAEEGGYGALLSAFRCPGRYRMVVALSSGSLTDERFEGREKKLVENAFGTASGEELSEGEYALQHWIGKSDDSGLRVYLAYSEKDKYYHSADKLRKDLQKKNGSLVTAEILPEPLTWKDWSDCLERVIEIG